MNSRMKWLKDILWIMMLFAGVAGLFRLWFGLGDTTHLSDSYPWGLWKILNMIAGVALSTGGFTIGFLVYVLKLKQFKPRLLLILGLAAAGWLFNGQIAPSPTGAWMAAAEARIGRPATPVSYAGVARRTTVRAAAPGVGYGGVGGPASGVGVLPGAGAGRAGVGYSGGVGVNLGGPVNRVGVR